ncbi:hypothetical protein D9758_007934 [Tetrapyrgos nigripes]|uniref:DUF6533 domain-containing protein n=1 Tax=Tetrapyrgos nigripes TaxID=182062 RepID=A0A8H5D3J0_9AGAR|nr:hypothetical protein D9758_007934 [Tetrapyrgos nigripes]
MVSRTGQDPDSINGQRVANYLHLAGFVLLFWDHALTLSLEVKYLWKLSARITTALFLFNRYFALLTNVIVTVSFFDLSLTTSRFVPAIIDKHIIDSAFSCGVLFIFREISYVLIEVNVSILLTLRIYAIYECKNWVLASMLSFGAVLAGLAVYALFSTPSAGVTSSISLTPLGCHTMLDLVPQAVQGAAAWEALFVYDCLLFIMVVLRRYRKRKSLGFGRMPLLEMVIRDGAIYFAVMALANLANIFTFYFAGPFTRGSLSTIACCISVVLISRLTFKLRANADADVEVQVQSGSRTRGGTGIGIQRLRGEDAIPMSTLCFVDEREYGDGGGGDDGDGDGHSGDRDGHEKSDSETDRLRSTSHDRHDHVRPP